MWIAYRTIDGREDNLFPLFAQQTFDMMCKDDNYWYIALFNDEDKRIALFERERPNLSSLSHSLYPPLY